MSTSSVVPSCPSGNRKPRANPSPRPECIDLAERFGRRYRIEYEPAYQAQYGPRSRVDDPWLKILPCRAGHICPWGGAMLAAVTSTAGPTARKLAALPGVTIRQDGADGATLLFDVGAFSQVAKLMHPRRKRRPDLTEAQRAEVGRRLARGRKCVPKPIVGIAPETRPCVQRGLFDLGAESAPSANSGACGDCTNV
jgi:hypothetical protein